MTEQFGIRQGHNDVGYFRYTKLANDCSSYSIGGLRVLPTKIPEDLVFEALMHAMLGVITDIDGDDVISDGANRYVFTYEESQATIKRFLDFVCSHDCVRRHDMRTTGWRGKPVYFTILTIPKDLRGMNLGAAELWKRAKELKLSFSSNLCDLCVLLDDLTSEYEEEW